MKKIIWIIGILQTSGFLGAAFLYLFNWSGANILAISSLIFFIFIFIPLLFYFRKKERTKFETQMKKYENKNIEELTKNYSKK